MRIEKISTIVGLAVLLGGLLYSYARQMERLDRLCADVAELKATQGEIMKAIGAMEHERWRRDHPR